MKVFLRAHDLFEQMLFKAKNCYNGELYLFIYLFYILITWCGYRSHMSSHTATALLISDGMPGVDIHFVSAHRHDTWIGCGDA